MKEELEKIKIMEVPVMSQAIAKNLLKTSLPLDHIATPTDLILEEVNNLRNSG